MRRFVIIGQQAIASPLFSLTDVPGTSGRIDVLLRALRAALLVSHGLRKDTVVYLILLGGPMAPRTIRFDGSAVHFLRPDERNLASTVQKALCFAGKGAHFMDTREGIAVADAGLEAVLEDIGPARMFVLEEGSRDVRDAALEMKDAVFFVGDHKGFDDATRARIAGLGAEAIGVGPLSVQADDAITIVVNELDRRDAGYG